MKKTLLTILFLFYLSSAFACDCKIISKAENYEYSVLILTAKIDSNLNNGHVISVLETFKNTIDKSITLIYENSCSIAPKVGETWLLYAHKVEGNKIYVSQCSWSRSFSNPICLYNTPYQKDTNTKQSATGELHKDIQQLRKLKKAQD